MSVLWDVGSSSPVKFTKVSEVIASSFIKEVVTSETSVIIYHTTLRNAPEDSHFHTRRRQNLKDHRR
jgi:hypothetical protein